ncbi:MAG: hypothetical protein ACE5H0_07180 [Bacteroidota bacterium]
MVESSHLLITIGGCLLLYLLVRGQQRWYGQSLETEKEVEEIAKKREKIKVKSKEKKVLREKLITAFIIVSAIWVPFYALLMHRSLDQEGVQTWLTDYITAGITVILFFMFVHGFLKQMGTLAIRGKQKSETGRRTKKFEALLGSHHPLEPSLIRESLDIWEEKKPERIVFAGDAAKKITTKAGDEYFDLEWETEEAKRRTLIHKDRATFMSTLSYLDVLQVKEMIDTALQRRLGVNASIAQLVTEALKVRMTALDFDERDAAMFQTLIEGVKPVDGENGEPDKEVQEVQQDVIRMALEWVLCERFGFDPKNVTDFLNKAKLPTQINPLRRLVKDGIFFGGYHAEFVRLYQYDTNYAIFVVPYPFFEAFSFSDRDWIDSSYMPFPLPYTDFDWRCIHTIIIQIAPKEFEACNVLVPIYTDKDLRELPGMIPPHPIDQVTAQELRNFFVEESADELLYALIEKETELQRKKRFETQDLKLLEKLMRRLWMKIRNMRMQGVRANWQMALAFVFIGMFVMFLLFQVGLFGEVVKNGGQA